MYKPLLILILFCTIAGCSVPEDPPCKIRDIEISVGECQTDSTYNITLNFIYSNAGNEFFEIFGRENKPLGYYNLTDLPLSIENFKLSDKEYDYIRICINDNSDCCAEHEFIAPDCSDKSCEIRDLVVTPGDFLTDGKYNLTIDFIHENAGNEFFDVFGNENEPLGYFKLSELPVTIENYNTSGNDHDRIKVCINDNPNCCAVSEYLAPTRSEETCEIKELTVTPRDCITDGKYNLSIDFIHKNAGNEYFDVFGNGNVSLGYYKLADLPVTIENYETSGTDYDRIKVCINDNPDCCSVSEYLAPDCSEKTCEIRDLVVTPGDCITEGKYNLTINFIHENAGNEYFDVYGNGNESLGYYKLADLPITIENYETSGTDHDRIKVCINDNEECCAVSEYLAPDCSEKACEIKELTITPGDCITDGKYNLTIDFIHENAGNETFDVFGNENEPLGNYNLADLPLTIENYETSGGDYDRIKVCINDNEECCAVSEYLAPDCSEKACEIWDLELSTGECLTDSTYNLTINFNHTNTGNSLFEVFTRNNNYIGIYELAKLPVIISDFKKSGLEYDFIKVAINDNPDCSKAEEIKPPTCE